MRHLAVLILFFIIISPARAQFELFENLIQKPNVVHGDDFPLDLVWESGTHVPPEYGGKALPSGGAVVIITALTPTKNALGLTFTWRIEDSSGATRIEHASLSKNQFAFRAEERVSNFSHLISVKVEDSTTNQSAAESVSIPVRNPEVVVKAMSPTGALLEPSVSTLSLPAGSALSLIARAFYFTTQHENLSYSWLFDGERLSGGTNPDQLNLSVSAGSGSATKNLFLEVLMPGGTKKAVSNVKINIE